MNDYLQPDFYRFNTDSMELINWVKTKVIKADSILDLCAGCGYLGIEASQLLCPQFLTLVECQIDFFPYLKKNSQTFLPSVLVDIHIKKVSEFYPPHLYDLILINPPYYLPQNGNVSPDPRRAIARTFLIDNWTIFLEKILLCLSSRGKAFVILKNRPDIINEIEKALKKGDLNYKSDSLRGNKIFEIKKIGYKEK